MMITEYAQCNVIFFVVGPFHFINQIPFEGGDFEIKIINYKIYQFNYHIYCPTKYFSYSVYQS